MRANTMMDEVRLRPMATSEWAAVAELIYAGTNAWYQAHGRPPIFSGGPAVAELFCQVYETLDPGCCVVAEHAATGRLMGSCFYHPRETHVSLGIMNVHPAYFGLGVARRLLGLVIQVAEQQGKPLRLVSSAMNLDSYSLYTRAGFVPRCLYQDILLPVPAAGVPAAWREGVAQLSGVRSARLEDVPAMAALEREVSGIARQQDYRHFIENRQGIWHCSVLEDDAGRLAGFLASVAHAGSRMLGPGVARTEMGAAALLLAELEQHRSNAPVFLLPAEHTGLVQRAYSWGGRNVELHVHQVRGAFQPFQGVNLPTFMPETG